MWTAWLGSWSCVCPSGLLQAWTRAEHLHGLGGGPLRPGPHSRPSEFPHTAWPLPGPHPSQAHLLQHSLPRTPGGPPGPVCMLPGPGTCPSAEQAWRRAGERLCAGPEHSPRGLAGRGGLHCLSVQAPPAKQRGVNRALWRVDIQPSPGRPLTHHWTRKSSVSREASQPGGTVFSRKAGGAGVTLESEPQVRFERCPWPRWTGSRAGPGLLDPLGTWAGAGLPGVTALKGTSGS